jgi:hypothetical protein
MKSDFFSSETGGAAFSLTPALSRWEREKHSQRLGKARAGFSLGTYGFYKSNQRLFLLPAGEGQDEGERRAYPQTAQFGRTKLT